MSPESNEQSAPRKSSLARLVGGHFLNLLTQPEVQTDKTPVELAVDRENEVIDHRQRAHYDTNLFRELRPSIFRDIYPTTEDSLARLQVVRDALFEKEFASRNTIATRFALFADPFYETYINTLDLGETKQPGSHEEVTALKEEYHELLGYLVEKDIINGELSRANAKPTIHLSFNAQDEFVVATRNRKLFSFVDGARELSAAKRMTFLMPPDAFKGIQVPGHGGLRARQVAAIEKLIDAQDPEKIIPVRTVYYAKSKPLSGSAE